ncbi:hypothetical protein BJ508DRAFT_364560 [Ascobolus immersus RN42]|uniref:Uncharacterized protein n=1 Tax=Ascobolus immersus RN42 TaxID=1160509 RepID=A0A3N4HVX9_ASCIM|nr:hypothetical protein BJ508DRAFT_364560 [Ascobolus immersus RN42]
MEYTFLNHTGSWSNPGPHVDPEVIKSFIATYHKQLSPFLSRRKLEVVSFGEDEFRISVRSHTTHEEIGIPREYQDHKVTLYSDVRGCSVLDERGPDRSTRLMFRAVDDGEFGLEVMPSIKKTEILKAFTKMHGTLIEKATESERISVMVKRIRLDESYMPKFYWTYATGQQEPAINEAAPYAIVVIISHDWVNTGDLESLYGTTFVFTSTNHQGISTTESIPIYTSRDMWLDCAGPGYSRFMPQEITPGCDSGNMTSSAIFKQEGDTDNLYMIQCKHGYEDPEVGIKCFTPTPSRLYDPHRRRFVLPAPNTQSAYERNVHDILKEEVIYTLHGISNPEDLKKYPDPHDPALESIQTGEISHIIPNVDACFVKLAFPARLGRKVADMPNVLPDTTFDQSRSWSPYQKKHYKRKSPLTLTGVYSKPDVVAQYEGKTLYKLGSATGLRVIKTEPSIEYTLHISADGTRTMQKDGLVAVKSGRKYNTCTGDDEVEKITAGDSSAMVWDEKGLLIGIVKGRWYGWNWEGGSYIVPWYKIEQGMAEAGMGKFEIVVGTLTG